MAESAKTKKTDPGWNDPPMLNYSPSNPPPKSRIGNKRVAFPLFAQTKPTVTPQNDVRSEGRMHPGNININYSDAEFPDNSFDSSNKASRFQKVVSDIDTLLTSKDDQNGSMRQKIDVMKAMWQDDKFSIRMQFTILFMIKGIIEGDATQANELYSRLMTENSDLCDDWIVVFRQLIQATNLSS